MPIKPENRSRYPKNWTEIRQSILKRAQLKCEFCGVHQYAVGYRDHTGQFVYARGSAYYDQMQYAVDHKTANQAKETLNESGVQKHVVIVLTIAHLDHTPENNDHSNLRALCQKCHTDYDKPHHLRNAAITRANKRNGGGFLNFDGSAA